MIHEVDDSLRTLIRRDALNGSGVEVAFDAPTKEWAARRNQPTLNLYLYQVHEDPKRREVAYAPVRDDDGRITERRPPARRFNLSYMVTAWTQRPEDEHRLLSAALTGLLRHNHLPPEVLTGSLAEQGEPVMLTIGLPLPPDRSLNDVWSALGGELKPALDIVVSAPVPTGQVEVAGPPVLEEPRIRLVADTGRKSRRRTRAAEAGPARAEPPLAAESVVSGAQAHPGRTVHMRELQPPRR